jgi:hypothetical protein
MMGRSFFPEKLSQEFLDNAKKTMGSYLFSNQYLNEIIPSELQTFRKEWLKYYTHIPKTIRPSLLLILLSLKLTLLTILEWLFATLIMKSDGTCRMPKDIGYRPLNWLISSSGSTSNLSQTLLVSSKSPTKKLYFISWMKRCADGMFYFRSRVYSHLIRKLSRCGYSLSYQDLNGVTSIYLKGYKT